MDFRDKLVGAGMPHGLAVTVAKAVGGTSTSAEQISALGISGPLAIEIARQIKAGVYNVDYLMALGMPPAVANAIKAG